MSVWEDFKLKYAPPKVEGLTVGFSGIDPAGYAATLTEEQLEIVKALVLAYISHITIRIDSGSLDPNESPPEVQPVTLHPTDIPHELLDGLLGGDEDGHYHLTDVELDKLKAMIQTFVPDGTEVKVPIEDHEKLSSLMGGSTGQHYHFTSDEWTKLRKVLAKLFPDGATEPQFPSVPASTDESEEPEDIWGGLPKGTPPQWTQVAFPSGYSAWKEGVCMMYFGGVPITKTTVREELIMGMDNGSSNSANRSLMRTTNLSTWDEMCKVASGSTSSARLKYVSTRIIDYFLLSGNGRYQLYVMSDETTNEHNLNYLFTTSSSTDLVLSGKDISNKSASKTYYVAACYSPHLNIAIFVTLGGGVTCVQNNAGITTSGYTGISCGLSNVGTGAAAWNPDTRTFCVANNGKTAISSDGQTWNTYTTNLNLVRISYREDLGCLFAREYDKNLFYVSGDGITWQKLNNTPIPVSGRANPVAYSPDLGWYCAVGFTDKIAYFSKDLEHWISTTVTNGAAVDMGSVIWCGGSIKKFVLTTRSGNYFYTFDPTQWKDGD